MRINSFWRRILLHHHPVGITINGNVIFRQIGVIQAVTFNPFLASPLLEFFEVLTQAVSVVFRYHRRFAVWCAFGNMVVFLYAVQRAVFRLVLFVCTQLQAAEQIRRGTKQREIPATELVFHDSAQQTMQRNQRRFAVQTFTVWRVAQHCTVRPFRQRIGQLRDIFHLKGDQFTNPRKTGVSARTLNHTCVTVRTVEMGAILRQAFTGTSLRFRFHFLPDSFIMLRPAAKAPTPTVQARCAVGRQHRRFNQQRTRTTHWIEQRCSWLPAGSHNNRGCQGFFDRRNTSTIAIATQM